MNCLCDYKIDAHISMRSVFDVIKRWDRDIRRVAEGQDDHVNPVKYIAYQTFWLRKLKPVSNAYRNSDLEEYKKRAASDMASAKRWLINKEFIEINEALAVLVAVKQILLYTKNGSFPAPFSSGQFHDNSSIGRPLEIKEAALREYLSYYLKYATSKSSESSLRNSTLDNLVYNLRYRTFGPHHLTHVFEQAIMAVQRTG